MSDIELLPRVHRFFNKAKYITEGLITVGMDLPETNNLFYYDKQRLGFQGMHKPTT